MRGIWAEPQSTMFPVDVPGVSGLQYAAWPHIRVKGFTQHKRVCIKRSMARRSLAANNRDSLFLKEFKMLQYPVWIVVANASRARIMERRQAGEPLLQREDRVHPASRQHPRAALAELPGHTIGGRSALAPRITLRERERKEFAHELAYCLRGHWRQNEIGDLVVYASNPFLGEMLAQLNGPVGCKVKAHEAIDMTSWPLSQIEARLERDLAL